MGRMWHRYEPIVKLTMLTRFEEICVAKQLQTITIIAEIGHWQLRNPHQVMDEKRCFVFNRTFALLENATYRR